jgi:hypothetical protein
LLDLVDWLASCISIRQSSDISFSACVSRLSVKRMMPIVKVNCTIAHTG